VITQAHTQIVMGVLSAAAHMANKHTEIETGRHQLHATAARYEHERGVFETKSGVMRKLIEALIEKRVAAVKDGFSEVLGLYAEQARHYMKQQEKYTDAMIEKTDPLVRAEYQKRLNDTDIELRRIRSDAKQIYIQMTEIVLLLGGGNLDLGEEFNVSLGLGSKVIRHG
jgi:uncharacterized protein YPO0396